MDLEYPADKEKCIKVSSEEDKAELVLSKISELDGIDIK